MMMIIILWWWWIFRQAIWLRWQNWCVVFRQHSRQWWQWSYCRSNAYHWTCNRCCNFSFLKKKKTDIINYNNFQSLSTTNSKMKMTISITTTIIIIIIIVQNAVHCVTAIWRRCEATLRLRCSLKRRGTCTASRTWCFSLRHRLSTTTMSACTRCWRRACRSAAWLASVWRALTPTSLRCCSPSAKCCSRDNTPLINKPPTECKSISVVLSLTVKPKPQRIDFEAHCRALWCSRQREKQMGVARCTRTVVAVVVCVDQRCTARHAAAARRRHWSRARSSVGCRSSRRRSSHWARFVFRRTIGRCMQYIFDFHLNSFFFLFVIFFFFFPTLCFC